jgi:hypothetical protein
MTISILVDPNLCYVAGYMPDTLRDKRYFVVYGTEPGKIMFCWVNPMTSLYGTYGRFMFTVIGISIQSMFKAGKVLVKRDHYVTT